MQAEEDDDAFFTQAAEAIDEAEAAYYRRHVSQSNAGEPSHMNEEEENAFLSQPQMKRRPLTTDERHIRAM